MTGNLLAALPTAAIITVGARVLVLRLPSIPHHCAWSILGHSLVVRRVRDVCQVVARRVALPLITLRLIRPLFLILHVMMLLFRAWLDNKSRHVILKILLHQQIIIAIIIEQVILVVVLHDLVHPIVVVVEVEVIRQLGRKIILFLFARQFLPMLLQEQLQLLTNLLLREALGALASRGTLTTLALFFESFGVAKRVKRVVC